MQQLYKPLMERQFACYPQHWCYQALIWHSIYHYIMLEGLSTAILIINSRSSCISAHVLVLQEFSLQFIRLKTCCTQPQLLKRYIWKCNIQLIRFGQTERGFIEKLEEIGRQKQSICEEMSKTSGEKEERTQSDGGRDCTRHNRPSSLLRHP